MADTVQVRDYLNEKVIRSFGIRLHAVWPAFDVNAFTGLILPHLPDWSFSERVQGISRALERVLPADFPKAVSILLKALPEPMPGSGEGEGMAHFIVAPQTAFISRCGQEHVDLSLEALKEMTRRFTAEWDLRLFFEKDPERIRTTLFTWARDPDQHVRRLVSEGTRPYVPWGKKLTVVEQYPELTLDLLERLKNDPEEYVRRSVANHLNDLSKKHPERVVRTLKRWAREDPGPAMDKLVKHALRSLIKMGHPGALRLLGYAPGGEVEIRQFKIEPKTIHFGDALEFSFELVSTSPKPQSLVVDYIVYFRKANGTNSPKVFKLKTLTLGAEEVSQIRKKHTIRPITTRVYYPGQHQLGVQVNGVEIAKASFTLTM
ncbi:MAG: DNA alkylation repair protein [Saprospiraceae bacterium]